MPFLPFSAGRGDHLKDRWFRASDLKLLMQFGVGDGFKWKRLDPNKGDELCVRVTVVERTRSIWDIICDC